MRLKKYRFAGRFVIVCFLLFSCIYNTSHFLPETATSTSSLTEKSTEKGENKAGTEKETHLVTVSQHRCQSAIKTPQKQERQLKASLNGCSRALGNMTALQAGSYLEKPYYYILLFRHNLF